MFTVINRYLLGNCRILSVLAVLGPHEAVQPVTQRAREALHDQRETARRAPLHQQGEILAVTHQYEAAAKQNLVSALACEADCHAGRPHAECCTSPSDTNSDQG